MSEQDCVDLTLLDSDSDEEEQDITCIGVEKTESVLPSPCASSSLQPQHHQGRCPFTPNPQSASSTRNQVCETESLSATATKRYIKERPETSTTTPSRNESRDSEQDTPSEQDTAYTSSPATTDKVHQIQLKDITKHPDPTITDRQDKGEEDMSDEHGKMDLTLRVGFFGNLSVGKSTILNTILGERYNPTSLKRETSGIRLFQVIRHARRTPQKRKSREIAENPEASMDVEKADQVRNIREQIQQDNDIQRNRETLDTPMEIPIDMPRNFFGDQREDVALSFVDIPGLNEAKQELYSSWVTSNWMTFDCAVVVLDTTHDCSAQDVRCLLNLVHKCHTEVREIPIIFVANKMDDASNQALKDMVAGLQDHLKATFEGVLEIQPFDASMDGPLAPLGPNQGAFVPMSAQYALLFEVARRGWNQGCYEQGKKEFMAADVDFALIDRFGVEEVGKNKWKKLDNKEDKIIRVYNELKDKDLLQTRMKDANFRTFEKILKATICGKEQQTLLLKSQLECALRKPVPYTHMFDHLRETQGKAVALEQSTDIVTNFFWKTYEKYEQDGKKKLTEAVDQKALAVSAFLLTIYHKFAVESKLSGNEIDKVTQAFKDLVQLQVSLVLKKFYLYWKEHPSRAPPRAPGCSTWDSMAADEWATVFDSMLLAADGHEFKNNFGPEVVAITRALRKVSPYTSDCSPTLDAPIPRSMNDDNHWGYVINSYCNFNRVLQV